MIIEYIKLQLLINLGIIIRFGIGERLLLR